MAKTIWIKVNGGAAKIGLSLIKSSKGVATYEITNWDDLRLDPKFLSHPETESLGFRILNEAKCENLDKSGDAWQCFGLSHHLKVLGVEFNELEIAAENLTQIKDALMHIEIESYDTWDI